MDGVHLLQDPNRVGVPYFVKWGEASSKKGEGGQGFLLRLHRSPQEEEEGRGCFLKRGAVAEAELSEFLICLENAAEKSMNLERNGLGPLASQLRQLGSSEKRLPRNLLVHCRFPSVKILKCISSPFSDKLNGNHDEAGKGQSQSFQDILHMFMFIHFLCILYTLIRISQNYRFLASPLRAGTDLVGT